MNLDLLREARAALDETRRLCESSEGLDSDRIMKLIAKAHRLRKRAQDQTYLNVKFQVGRKRTCSYCGMPITKLICPSCGGYNE